ncbi:MAG: glycosyltransferase [Anaerolineales bacterium]
MNITILTYGSRGDVQPFLPLSAKLISRGHSVKLAAPQRFQNLIEGHGISFVPLAGDPEVGRRMNNVSFNPFKQMREMMDHAIAIGADVARQTDEACRDADLIIHTFAHTVGAHTTAREMNIPDVHIQTFPMFTPTGDYPNVAMPDLKLRALNYFSHYASSRISKWTAKFGYEQVRRRADCPSVNFIFHLTTIRRALRR